MLVFPAMGPLDLLNGVHGGNSADFLAGGNCAVGMVPNAAAGGVAAIADRGAERRAERRGHALPFTYFRAAG